MLACAMNAMSRYSRAQASLGGTMAKSVTSQFVGLTPVTSLSDQKETTFEGSSIRAGQAARTFKTMEVVKA